MKYHNNPCIHYQDIMHATIYRVKNRAILTSTIRKLSKVAQSYGYSKVCLLKNQNTKFIRKRINEDTLILMFNALVDFQRIKIRPRHTHIYMCVF